MYKLFRNTGLVLAFSVSVCLSSGTQANGTMPSWLDAQLNKDPDVKEARALLNAAAFQAKSLSKPRYNPNIEASYEKEGDFNNYSLGFSQSIDVWDKRAVKTTIGEIGHNLAQQRLTGLLQMKKSEAVHALLIWRSAMLSAQLTEKREQHLKSLLVIIEDKRKAGILGPLDVELIYLSLSQILRDIVERKVHLKEAKVRVRTILPDWRPESTVLPVNGFGITEYHYQAEWIAQHPNVQVAKAKWEMARQEARSATVDAKAEPTVGLNAGRSGNENTIGVSFSMPLNIRNNYSDAIKAAHSEAVAAEAHFQSTHRKQRFEAKLAYETVVESKQYFEQWQKLMNGKAENSLKLLTARWEAGDMATADYLIALNQRAEGLQAGIELERQFRLSEIAFLLSIGQISKLNI